MKPIRHRKVVIRRASGIGERLVAWLVAEMKREGWSRLYWHTRHNNYRARGLYDKFTPHSDFVRYTVYAEGGAFAPPRR